MAASRAALTPEEREQEDYLMSRFEMLPIAERVAILTSEVLAEQFRQEALASRKPQGGASLFGYNRLQ
jgi:hypothetical protein